MFETLLLIGIGCVIAAVVGGGLKLANFETPEIRSLWRQAALAAVGLVIVGTDIALVKNNKSGPTPSPTPKKGPQAHKVPASGTYTGKAAQRGAASGINKDYPVTMSFSAAGSTVSYETLDCFGNLIPQGFDGRWRLYSEQITSGHCDQGGTWRVRVDAPRELEAKWSSPASNYTVAVVLTR